MTTTRLHDKLILDVFAAARSGTIHSSFTADMRSPSQQTLMHVFSLTGNLSMAKALFRDHNVSLNDQDELGRTPLMYSSQHGSPKSLAYLLRRGAKLNTKDSTGWTALTFAAAHGRDDNTKYLLEYAAVKGNTTLVNAVDFKTRNSALHYAAENRHPKVMEWLLEHGADAELENSSGETAILITLRAHAGGKSPEWAVMKTSLGKLEKNKLCDQRGLVIHDLHNTIATDYVSKVDHEALLVEQGERASKVLQKTVKKHKQRVFNAAVTLALPVLVIVILACRFALDLIRDNRTTGWGAVFMTFVIFFFGPFVLAAFEHFDPKKSTKKIKTPESSIDSESTEVPKEIDTIIAPKDS